MFAFLTAAAPLSSLSETKTLFVISNMAAPKTLIATKTKAAPVTPYTASYGGQSTSRQLAYLFAAAVVLSTIALSISGYLSYVAFTSSKILGCGGGVFNCDHVLTSKWSTFLGLPVAAWAGSMYLGVLAALLSTVRPAISASPSLIRQWTWAIVTTAAVSAGLAALWFIGLQAFVLEHYCPWCLGAHTCGVLLCIGTLSFSPLAGRVKAVCASLGLAATLGLVVIQTLSPEPQSYIIDEYPQAPLDGGVIEEPATFDAPGADGADVFMAPDAQSSTRSANRWFVEVDQAVRSLVNPVAMLTSQVGDAAQPPAGGEAAQAAPQPRAILLSGANIKLRPEQWPMLGSPDAPKIFVELFDYTCSHCRKTQKAILGAREQLKEELGIILIPVPLNRNCNPHANGNPNPNACELAELALAVWKADAADKAQFQKFHEWVLEGPNPPALAAAKARAEQAVGADKLQAEKATAQKFIRSNVDIYRKMNAGPIPKLIFPTTVLTGELQNPGVLVQTINRQPKQ